jgi:hypothetical protein
MACSIDVNDFKSKFNAQNFNVKLNNLIGFGKSGIVFTGSTVNTGTRKGWNSVTSCVPTPNVAIKLIVDKAICVGARHVVGPNTTWKERGLNEIKAQASLALADVSPKIYCSGLFELGEFHGVAIASTLMTMDMLAYLRTANDINKARVIALAILRLEALSYKKQLYSDVKVANMLVKVAHTFPSNVYFGDVDVQYCYGNCVGKKDSLNLSQSDIFVLNSLELLQSILAMNYGISEHNTPLYILRIFQALRQSTNSQVNLVNLLVRADIAMQQGLYHYAAKAWGTYSPKSKSAKEMAKQFVSTFINVISKLPVVQTSQCRPLETAFQRSIGLNTKCMSSKTSYIATPQMLSRQLTYIVNTFA